MKYSDKIPIDDLKIMSDNRGMFKNYIFEKFLNNEPPNFVDSYKELLVLKNIPKDKAYVKHYDDIESIFMNYFDWDDDIKRLINQLLGDSAKIIMILKWNYNRLRPYQLAEKTNLNIEPVRLYSMETPAYPSGHSAQGYLLASYLTNKYPKHQSKLYEIAKNISYSRLVARAHYPSDTNFGRTIGLDMANHLINYSSLNQELPFSEEIYDDYVIRKFDSNLDESELKWHFDEEDRLVIPLNENDWKFQFDNNLPQNINENIFIPKGKYHRVIKGDTDLIIKINKKQIKWD